VTVVKIVGLGGQGVVYMGWVLGYAAGLRGYYASVTSSYGAEVRGGEVSTTVVISAGSEYSPFARRADVMLVLHECGLRRVGEVEPRLLIADSSLEGREEITARKVVWKPFLAEAARTGLSANMLALGYLARHVPEVGLEDLIEAVRAGGRDVEANVKALRRGYEL